MKDYNGLYRDLMAMRERAMGSSLWCEHGNWEGVAQLVSEIDRFVEELDQRNWSNVN